MRQRFSKRENHRISRLFNPSITNEFNNNPNPSHRALKTGKRERVERDKTVNERGNLNNRLIRREIRDEEREICLNLANFNFALPAKGNVYSQTSRTRDCYHRLTPSPLSLSLSLSTFFHPPLPFVSLEK